MSGPTIAGQCDKCGGWVTQCNCAALPDVRSEPLLAALRTHIDRRLLDLKDKAAEFKHDNEMTYAINGAMFELMDLLQWLKEYTANAPREAGAVAPSLHADVGQEVTP